MNPGLSLASTNRPIRSSPRVHVTESSGKPKFATCTDPDDFWHERQWQYKNRNGSPVTSKATLPQKHDPFSVSIKSRTVGLNGRERAAEHATGCDRGVQCRP